MDTLECDNFVDKCLRFRHVCGVEDRVADLEFTARLLREELKCPLKFAICGEGLFGEPFGKFRRIVYHTAAVVFRRGALIVVLAR